MNFTEQIAELRTRKAHCERAIALLEELHKSYTSDGRGRKFMGLDERQQVSERMRNYWARRRQAAAAGND